MLISKRPIKLAVAAVSLAAIAAMSAPPAVAASTPHDTAISPQDRAILTEQQMPGSPLGLPSEAAGPVQTNYWSAVDTPLHTRPRCPLALTISVASPRRVSTQWFLSQEQRQMPIPHGQRCRKN